MSRRRYHPSKVRALLHDVIGLGKTVEASAKDHDVEIWTAYHWCQNAKKYGVEETILSFYPKKDLIKLIMRLRHTPKYNPEFIESEVASR